ncbi:MAG TPA: LysR family transcriptional regulator [Oligoflexia bacterium]|nr:LysR family transcriptional regulator [Oligoflexia bacterium]HMR25407.1 LysR family transcriptional regulator [Oligoflexia bacterium]
MIEYVQTLKALADFKTMHKAATALRVSQPTVSKRIAILERQVNKKLIQKNGRNVDITADGRLLLDQVYPHLLSIRSILNAQPNSLSTNIQVGFSESILIAWGGDLLSAVNESKKISLQLVPHAHRSPVVLDRVISGEYMFGLCAGGANKVGDMQVEKLFDEPMVLINPTLDKPLMGIEQSSETMQSIERKLSKQGLIPNHYLESYAAIVRLAQKKLFKAIVPLGVCKAFNISFSYYKKLNISRPLIFVARQNIFQREDIQVVYQLLKRFFAQ